MSSIPHRWLGGLVVPPLLISPTPALADRLRAIESSRLLRVGVGQDDCGISRRHGPDPIVAR